MAIETLEPQFENGVLICVGCRHTEFPGIRVPANSQFTTAQEAIDNGGAAIERCDTCELYSCDQDAARAIFAEFAEVNGSYVGSSLHGEREFHIGIMRGPSIGGETFTYYLHSKGFGGAMSLMMESMGMHKGADPISAVIGMLQRKMRWTPDRMPIRFKASYSEDPNDPTRFIWAITCHPR